VGSGRGWRQREAWRAQARELKQARSLQQDDQEYGSYKVVTVEVFESNRCYMDEYSICAHLGCTLRTRAALYKCLHTAAHLP
jgi:Rieske Fe-S protein